MPIFGEKRANFALQNRNLIFKSDYLPLDFNKYGKVPVKDDDRFVPHLGKMPSYLVNSGHN